MTQAITTHYVGPSNVRGSRIIAVCAASRHIHQYDDGLSATINHREAAFKLAKRLEWKGTWHAGVTKDGGHVFVCQEDEPAFTI